MIRTDSGKGIRSSAGRLLRERSNLKVDRELQALHARANSGDQLGKNLWRLFGNVLKHLG